MVPLGERMKKKSRILAARIKYEEGNKGGSNIAVASLVGFL